MNLQAMQLFWSCLERDLQSRCKAFPPTRSSDGTKNFRVYLEGHADLANGLRMGSSGVTTGLKGVGKLLTKYP